MDSSNTPSFDEIAQALGLADLGPDEQETLLADLQGLVFQGTLLRAIERMDAETRDAFVDLMAKSPSEDEVLAFLSERVPGADQAAAEALAELTDDILAVSQS